MQKVFLVLTIVLSISTIALADNSALQARHQKMMIYHGDQFQMRNAQHTFQTVGDKVFSIFSENGKSSYYAESGGKTYYATVEFKRQSDEVIVAHYALYLGDGQRTSGVRFKVEYENSPNARGYRVVFDESSRGFVNSAKCWACLSGAVGTGTSCYICIAAPTCWGTWGAGCVACIPPCASLVSSMFICYSVCWE